MDKIEIKHTCIPFKNFTWIDICNPKITDLDAIAKEYELDFFQITDSLEKGHLPKFEKNGNYNFLILRAYFNQAGNNAYTVNSFSNKISFFFNANKIITIHRAPFEFLKLVHSDFENSEDLLVFLIHKMIESYQIPIKKLSDQTDDFEKTVFLKDTAKFSLKDLYYLKTQTRVSKKLLVISQSVINQLEVSAKSKTALQDIKDQLLSLILGYEEVYENATHLLNTYLSVNAQKNNDVMKLLTVFSAFFLPLTFIVGVYGMNFKNMPELNTQNGYFIIVGVMICIALIIFFWFKRKRII